jgi:hypothetical protein
MQRAWDRWLALVSRSVPKRIAFLTRLAELLEERAETYYRRDNK